MIPLLTVPEVAARLRCSEWTTKRLIASGHIEGSKVAGRWLVSEAAVEAFLAATSNRGSSTTRRRRKRTSP